MSKIELIDEKDLFNTEYLDILDIKSLNDKEKVILTIFINRYIHLNPTISKYNNYAYLLFNNFDPLNVKTIFRGVFVSIDQLYQNKITLNVDKVLQVGVLPTFLEAYLYLNNVSKNTKYDFIKINSSKLLGSNNINLYDEIIQKFININHNLNMININDFYSSKINDLIDNKSLKDKYELIIFDTYKNINKTDDRYLSSIVHTKYIYHQVIFILNKLEKNGEMIILLPGYQHLVYQQIITVLRKLFDKVILSHSEFDYSYRYFVIGKNYKPNDEILKDLIKKYEKIDINSSNVLMSLGIDTDKDIIRYDQVLQEKFNKINSKIQSIKPYLNNDKLIKKIYYDIYFNQVTKTNIWLTNIFSLNQEHHIKINEEFYTIIFDYKSYLFDKITSYDIKSYKYPIKLFKNGKSKIKILGDNLSNEDFNTIIKPLEYIRLFNLICFDDVNYNYNKYQLLKNEINPYSNINERFPEYDIQTIDILNLIETNDSKNSSNKNIIYSSDDNIKQIFDNNKIHNILYLDYEYIKKINILKDNLDVIIKFNLNQITPLLVSLMYILSKTYNDVKINISINKNEYYLVCRSKKTEVLHVDKLLEKTLTDNTFLVSITEEFVNVIDNIVSKLIVKELCDVIRYKYINDYPEYALFYNLLMKKTNKDVRLQKLIIKNIISNKK